MLADDAQLTLHCIHELTYSGFAGVEEDWETDPAVVGMRVDLERSFEARLRDELGPCRDDPHDVLDELSSGSGRSLSSWLLHHGGRAHLDEFLVHRADYQLKEADPHSRALPCVRGLAKSALVRIQFDEYGLGEPGRAHAELYAATLASMGVDHHYGTYIDRWPATTLATTNLISMLGGSRRLLGGLIGHLTLFEMTSVAPMSRYSEVIARAGGDRIARAFYDVHVEADAEHGPLARDVLVPAWLAEHPASAPVVAFGARALDLVESSFTGHLLDCWERGTTSLRDEQGRPDDLSPPGVEQLVATVVQLDEPGGTRCSSASHLVCCGYAPAGVRQA